MATEPFHERASICPADWRQHEGWTKLGADAVPFLDALIDGMNGALAMEGYDAFWLINDHHRLMKIEPYIMLGVRPVDTKQSILIAFGFSYENARRWPKGFIDHYAACIGAHYETFENAYLMPSANPHDTALAEFCAKNNVQPVLWTLPPDYYERCNGREAAAPEPDLFAFEDEGETDEWGDPIEVDPLS